MGVEIYWNALFYILIYSLKCRALLKNLEKHKLKLTQLKVNLRFQLNYFYA